MNTPYLEQEQFSEVWNKQTVCSDDWKTATKPLDSNVVSCYTLSIMIQRDAPDSVDDELLDRVDDEFDIDDIYDDSMMSEEEFAAYQRALSWPASTIQVREVPEV
jgi:hypothetical protein